jgi:hypothetical protein
MHNRDAEIALVDNVARDKAPPKPLNRQPAETRAEPTARRSSLKKEQAERNSPAIITSFNHIQERNGFEIKKVAAAKRRHG